MSLCVATAAGLIRIAATGFTLAWTHSVERIEWWERWEVTPAGLEIVEARVRGSGAGMEPPEGARPVEGGWSYHPVLPPRPDLVLAASGATGGGWTLCAAGECRVLASEPGPPVTLSPCD